jgi:hypothetical protein
LAANLAHVQSQHFRLLRFYATLLKDIDRIEIGPNNFVLDGDDFAIYNFGGTLGSRPFGEFKNGPVVSEAIGAFEPSEHMSTLFNNVAFYGYQAGLIGSDHAWNKVTAKDADQFANSLKFLTNMDVQQIVAAAQFSKKKDAKTMETSIKTRRDAFIKKFPAHFRKLIREGRSETNQVQ